MLYKEHCSSGEVEMAGFELEVFIFGPSQMLCMALFRNLILIVLSDIILCQAEGIRAILVSYLISGSVSDVNNNKFENHKNSTFKHFLPSGVWTVRHMISDFCIRVGVTLII